MNVWLKRVLFSLVVALLLAVVGLAIFLLTFNPNAYKSRVESLGFELAPRTLPIGGHIGLSRFARISPSARDRSASGPDTTAPFVSTDPDRCAGAIWPLLPNRLAADHAVITGLKATVIRD